MTALALSILHMCEVSHAAHMTNTQSMCVMWACHEFKGQQVLLDESDTAIFCLDMAINCSSAASSPTRSCVVTYHVT